MRILCGSLRNTQWILGDYSGYHRRILRGEHDDCVRIPRVSYEYPLRILGGSGEDLGEYSEDPWGML